MELGPERHDSAAGRHADRRAAGEPTGSHGDARGALQRLPATCVAQRRTERSPPTSDQTTVARPDASTPTSTGATRLDNRRRPASAPLEVRRAAWVRCVPAGWAGARPRPPAAARADGERLGDRPRSSTSANRESVTGADHTPPGERSAARATSRFPPWVHQAATAVPSAPRATAGAPPRLRGDRRGRLPRPVGESRRPDGRPRIARPPAPRPPRCRRRPARRAR